jgi:hypothetical protein
MFITYDLRCHTDLARDICHTYHQAKFAFEGNRLVNKVSKPVLLGNVRIDGYGFPFERWQVEVKPCV